MKELERLFDRIIQRVNVNLREHNYDVNPLVRDLISADKMTKFYAFYGVTPHHPLNFQFRRSNLAGSHFMGKCQVTNSLLYKSDIRGDELKKKETCSSIRILRSLLTRMKKLKLKIAFS